MKENKEMLAGGGRYMGSTESCWVFLVVVCILTHFKRENIKTVFLNIVILLIHAWNGMSQALLKCRLMSPTLIFYWKRGKGGSDICECLWRYTWTVQYKNHPVQQHKHLLYERCQMHRFNCILSISKRFKSHHRQFILTEYLFPGDFKGQWIYLVLEWKASIFCTHALNHQVSRDGTGDGIYFSSLNVFSC